MQLFANLVHALLQTQNVQYMQPLLFPHDQRDQLSKVVTVTQVQNNLRCHYTSCVVEGFIQPLDKLYANTFISFSTSDDEMYIDLQ